MQYVTFIKNDLQSLPTWFFSNSDRGTLVYSTAITGHTKLIGFYNYNGCSEGDENKWQNQQVTKCLYLKMTAFKFKQ